MGAFVLWWGDRVQAAPVAGLLPALLNAVLVAVATAARRPGVAVVAVADLVIAMWIAVGGRRRDPEAYTLPAALGLMVMAVRGCGPEPGRGAAEGAAACVPQCLELGTAGPLLVVRTTSAGGSRPGRPCLVSQMR